MKQKIRVVRIIDRLNVGGPAKHVTWLTAGLDAEEFETTLITGIVPEHEGDMSWFAHNAGIEPLVIKEMSRELSLRDVLVIFKLLRELFRLQPQIVHTHKAKAGAVGRVAATLYKWLTPSTLWLQPRRCRILHTFHGHIFHSYYSPAKTQVFVWIERLLARYCTDRIITISEQQRREINEEVGIGDARQFRVIPLGIDCAEGQTQQPARPLREEYGIPGGVLAVGIVGRLCEVKNHALLLRVIARLKEQEPELSQRARFLLIGGGELQEELEALATELKINDCLVFTGFRNDALALYPQLDLVVLTSLNEGTPLTLIEAMNAGRAVLSTEVGGVVDILGQRQETFAGCQLWEHGVTAPSRAVEAYARGLAYLLERPALRAQMGERGQAFVRARLSRERLVRDIERLYRELLAVSL
jgi:glycosyltransferase involved in cell wall biosynthesis